VKPNPFHLDTGHAVGQGKGMAKKAKRFQDLRQNSGHSEILSSNGKHLRRLLEKLTN
jgi:hypothetical protein